jgi:hypothetical protein
LLAGLDLGCIALHRSWFQTIFVFIYFLMFLFTQLNHDPNISLVRSLVLKTSALLYFYALLIYGCILHSFVWLIILWGNVILIRESWFV